MPNYEELLNQDFSSTEEALDTFITVYKDAGKYSDAIRKTAKGKIEEIVIETGQTDWATAAGRVLVPMPAKVTKWDTKALEVLCEALPELKNLIWHLRTVEERPGSLTIR